MRTRRKSGILGFLMNSKEANTSTDTHSSPPEQSRAFPPPSPSKKSIPAFVPPPPPIVPVKNDHASTKQSYEKKTINPPSSFVTVPEKNQPPLPPKRIPPPFVPPPRVPPPVPTSKISPEKHSKLPSPPKPPSM